MIVTINAFVAKLKKCRHIKGKFILFYLVFCSTIFYSMVSIKADITGVISEQEIRLYLGESHVFSAYKPYRVVIANPQVADVVNTAESAITLVTKSAGITSFSFWDIFGEHSFKIKVLLEDMQEVKKRIDMLLQELHLPNLYTKLNEEEGKIILLGEVRNQEEKDRIDLILGALKEKTLDLVKIREESGIVEIYVDVLELSKDASTALGFSWPGSITLTEAGSPALSQTEETQIGDTESTTGGEIAGGEWGSLFRVLRVSREAFTLTLDALVQEGKARILSQPKLACLSGKEAELLVGGEKPIFTTAVQVGGGSSTEVEYKEYGIKLKIRPTITQDKRVYVALGVEVSEIGTAETIGSATAPTAKAYPLTRRDITTELYLNNGQTLSIGGLVRQKQEEDIRKFPILGDIPILGMVFRQKTNTSGGGAGERGNMELFITLTPTIVSDVLAETTGESSATAMSSSTVKDVSLSSLSYLPGQLQSYIQTVLTKVVNSIYYPQTAKESNLEGTATLNLFLASDGSLKDVRVVRSSGYKILDDAAVDVVRRQAPYPPFPNQMNLNELNIEIPIIYRKN